MSYKVTALIRARKVGSPTRKCILLVMSDVANHDGSDVWVSTQTMANETEVSVRTIKRQLKDMESEGIISRTGKKPCMGGHTVIYKINLESVNALEKSGDNLSFSESKAVTLETEVVSEGAKKDALSVTQTVLEQSSLNNTPIAPKGTDEFDKLWKDISPSIKKSRRQKQSAKVSFDRMVKTGYAPAVLSAALRAFYRDKDISKNNHEFAPALHRAITQRRFEPYLNDSGDSAVSQFIKSRQAPSSRPKSKYEYHGDES